MPKFTQGQSIGFVGYMRDSDAPIRGHRLVLQVNEDDRTYRVGPYYEVGQDTATAETETMGVSYTDDYYRAVTGGGEENAPVDTSQVAELEAKVTNLIATVDNQRAQITDLQALQAHHQSDIEIIGEELLEEAERRGWCSDFDGWVDGVNARLTVSELPTREHDYNVTLSYTVDVYVSVTARSESDAVDQAYESFHEPGEVSYQSVSWDFNGGEASEE